MDIIPVHSIESEQLIIGHLLLNYTSFERVSFLKAEDFYSRPHRFYFSKMIELADKGQAYDMVVFAEEMTSQELNDCGGFAYLAEMAKHSFTLPELIVPHADRIKGFAMRRNAIRAMQEAIDQLSENSNDAMGVLASVSDSIDKALVSVSKSDSLTVQDLIEQSIDEMEKSMQGHRVGVESGIPEIDERLGYKFLAFGELTVFGALSGNGKTLTANTIASRAKLIDNECMHIFSSEMPSVGMFNGIISAGANNVPSNLYNREPMYRKINSPGTDEMIARWGAEANRLLEEDRITIDGENCIDADYVVANIRKQYAIARNKGKRLRLVFLDHFHRMDFNASGQNMTYAMRDAARKLKNVAAELDIALVVLAQLNNKSEKEKPSSFHILDTSSLRHEMQAFIGTRVYRQNGGTYIGIYPDPKRYCDMYTKVEPVYMKLVGGVMRSLAEGEYFTPEAE